MRKHLQSAVNILLMILLLGVGMVLGRQGKGWGQEPVVIAEWNFENATKRSNIIDHDSWLSNPYTADDGIDLNKDIAYIILSGSSNFYRFDLEDRWLYGVGGGESNPLFAAAAIQWRDENYFQNNWLIKISTYGYYDITISSIQRSSTTGPRDFSIQYSFDNIIWNDVPSSEIIVRNNFINGKVDNLPFPDESFNRDELFIRWKLSSPFSVRAGTLTFPENDTIANNGTSRIDDIIIRGIPMPHIVSVTPVDGIELDCGSTSEVKALAQLPPVTSIIDSEGTSHQVNLNWGSIQGYNPSIPGVYPVTASFELPDGVIQTTLEVSTTVTVRPGTIVPEFDPIGPLCQGDEPPVLLPISRDEIEGVWWPEIIDASVPGTVSYTFHATEELCVLPYVACITVNETPQVTAGGDIEVLYGTQATLSGAVVTGGTDLSYFWSPESLFEDHTALRPSTIALTENVWVTLTVTNEHGCSSSDQLQITVEGDPLSAIPAAVPETVCAGVPVQLFANASGGLGDYTYLWTSDTNGGEYTIENPVVYPTTNTVFNLRVTDELDDTVEKLVLVTVYPLPDVSCPETITVASNANSFELGGGTPSGGIYYLDDTPVTQFDPAQAGVGIHTIDYIYRDDNRCESYCSFNIEVVEELPRRLLVTFNVNMLYAQKFDPGIDKVYVTGYMFNFAVPGARPEQQRLHPTENQMVYTCTRELPVGRYYYKYFVNEGWAGEEWPSAPIRIADISRNNNNVFNDYFGKPDDPTSVSYLSTQPIRVFPNPVQYTLYITSNGEEPLQQIRIINMLGQTVYAKHIDHNSSCRVDINNIPPGLYVVQVHSFTGWHSTKVQVSWATSKTTNGISRFTRDRPGNDLTMKHE